MYNAGFKITHGHGFQVTFENGYTVSVQFGASNYCSNSNVSLEESLKEYETLVHPFSVNVECPDAEVAVIAPGRGLIPMAEFDGDTVGARFTPEMVYKLMGKVRKMK